MLYEETEKKAIEKVYGVFAGYIRESPYLEWLWSEKLGYILLEISSEKRYIEQEFVITTAEQLFRTLLTEISTDVLQVTRGGHTGEIADPSEADEIAKCWKPYVDKLPEYHPICEKILAGEE